MLKDSVVPRLADLNAAGHFLECQQPTDVLPGLLTGKVVVGGDYLLSLACDQHCSLSKDALPVLFKPALY
ncbi:UNVERIFIED_CONTAM: hypothetical protein K2H54_032217 [Gekko kuhli]